MEEMLRMRGIDKEFAGVKVLQNVDFSLDKGEIRAILGANGAGKSTLMKILSGIYEKTKGTIDIEGKPAAMTNPIKARELGIAMIHQELSAVPAMTVLENFYLGREIRRNGILQNKKMLAEYMKIREEMGFLISPYSKMRELSVAKQQMLEIMKTIHTDAKILIMDEPTTSLTEEEKRTLFQTILKLKKNGKTIIYISHILEEIFEITDKVTIMRNGIIIGTYKTSELTVPIISERMSGEEYTENPGLPSHCDKTQEPILQVKGLSTKELKEISFSIRPGEIVGLAGLVGAGRTELAKAIFGADKIIGGTIIMGGKKVKIRSPKVAIRNGISYISEDRKKEGLLLKQELYKNSTLIQLKQMKKRGLLNFEKEKTFAENAIRKLSIKGGTIYTTVEKLSGGNQQKVVISKWVSEDRKVLIFDEPTKGIDIKAKEEIFRIIEEFTKKGVGILFISSDLKEVIRVADKILVMQEGKILKELSGNSTSEKEILDIILGS